MSISLRARFKLKKINHSLLLLLPLLSGAAEAAETGAKTSLEEIVVIGTKTFGTVKNNPQSISVIKQDQIEKKASTDVADQLEDIPGVQITDANAAGTRRVRIRGESSRRVTILVDGQELTDHSTYGTPLLMDVPDIQEIDVLRGPASVLYGSKAIGGVVNIITKNGGGNKPISGELGLGAFSASHGWYYNAAVFGQIKAFDYRLSYYQDLYNDIKSPASRYNSYEGKLKTTGKKSDALNLSLGYTFGEAQNQLLRLKLESSHLSSENWQEKAILTSSLMPLNSFKINLPKRDKQKVGLFYDGTDFNSVVKKVHFDAYYQKVKREFTNSLSSNIFATDDFTMLAVRGNVPKFVEERAIPQTLEALSGILAPIELEIATRSKDDLINYGGTFQMDFQLPKRHYVLLGVNYLSDQLKSHKATAMNFTHLPVPAFAASRFHIPTSVNRVSPSFDKAEMNTASVFVQDEWTLLDTLKLTSGFRYYKLKNRLRETTRADGAPNSDYHRLLKAFSLVYTGIDKTALRISYAEGYIPPNILQLYLPTSAGGIRSLPNYRLVPETSKNIEVGARYGGEQLTLDAVAFYTKAKNYISLRTCRGNPLCAGVSPFEPAGIAENADKAKTFGLEFTLSYSLAGTHFTPYITATAMRRKESLATRETYDTDVPKLSGRLGVRYDNVATKNPYWVDVFLRGATRNTLAPELSLANPGGNTPQEPIKSWVTLNLSMGKKIKLGADSQLQFAVALDNITNSKYRSSFTSLPGAARSLSFTTKLTF